MEETLNVVAEDEEPQTTTEDVLLDELDEKTRENENLVTTNKRLIYGLIGLGIVFIGVVIWAFSANS